MEFSLFVLIKNDNWLSSPQDKSKFIYQSFILLLYAKFIQVGGVKSIEIFCSLNCQQINQLTQGPVKYIINTLIAMFIDFSYSKIQ